MSTQQDVRFYPIPEIGRRLERLRQEDQRIGAQQHDWRAGMARRGDRYFGNEANVLTALEFAPELRGLLRFNEFAARVEFAGTPPWRKAAAGDRWTDGDDVHLAAWLQHLSIDARPAVVGPAVEVAARKNLFHPVLEYLDTIEWDGKPRLASWLSDYLNACGPADYLAAVGSAWIKSAVARVLFPGCKVDCVLVLEGEQGAGKSRAAAALAVQPDWFTDSLPDLHSKDAALQLAGKWIIELSELSAIRRSEIENVKGFLSRQTDTYRPPYAARTVQQPRQSVFIATTNSHAYLNDASGNRRFWPVRVGRIDVAALERDRGQLLCEALIRVRAGEVWHLTDAEAQLALREQERREVVTELESQVREYLDRLESQRILEVTMRRVLGEALHLDPGAPDYSERAGRLGPQVANAMRRHGWEQVGIVGKGENRRNLYRKVQGVTG